MLRKVFIYWLCFVQCVVIDSKVYSEPDSYVKTNNTVSQPSLRTWSRGLCAPGYTPKNLTFRSIDHRVTIECKPYCSNDCGNGYCAAPNFCQCHKGWYQVQTNRRAGSFLCAPACENCKADCPDICTTTTAPNLSLFIKKLLPESHIKEAFQTTSSITTQLKSNTYSHLVDNRTYKDDRTYQNRTEAERKVSGEVEHDYLYAESKEAKSRSWVEQYGVSILLPVVSLLTAVIVISVLVYWHRTPIMVYLRGRYYVVDDHLPDDKTYVQQVQYTKDTEDAEWKNIEL